GLEPQALAEEPDLLRARRILDLVVALGDGVVPGHRRGAYGPSGPSPKSEGRLPPCGERSPSRPPRQHARARETVQREQHPGRAAYDPELDRDLITRAFRFAAQAHEGQQRRSGEDFVLHPWGAAKICAQLRLDDETIAAALLHDVVEDTSTDIDDVREEFGDEVAKLVEGVTKLTRVHFQSREQAEAENYRKLI